jgi:hypothetical protein
MKDKLRGRCGFKLAGLLLALSLSLIEGRWGLCGQSLDQPDWSQGRLILSNSDSQGRSVYERGFFRIIFFTQGKDAVNPTDLNGNGVPDFVEDVALQLVVAHHIYCELAGFQHPLRSERYKEVSYIDVFLRSRGDGPNGLAFQTAQRAHVPAAPRARALPMKIAIEITPQRNVTPAHEYFHLIQYATVHMISPWYLEGMAAWSRDAFVATKPSQTPREEVNRLLHDPAGEAELFAASYNAAALLWNPLASLCPDGAEHLPKDDPLLRSRYVDGSPVLKDFIFRGAPIMRRVLQEFARLERQAFVDNGYEAWNLANRRDRRNYAYMLPGGQERDGKLLPCGVREIRCWATHTHIGVIAKSR